MEPRFAILGNTRLHVDGQLTDHWGPTKLRGILAVLLLHPGQSISFETMVEWVWPEGQEPERDSTFHTYGNRIRAKLNEMTHPPSLTVRDRAYRLDLDRQEIDFFVLRHAVARADTMSTAAEHEPAVTLLSAALQLWQGPPLSDAKGERARNFRQAAESTHLVHAHETLLRSLSALGRHDEVLRRWADLPLELQSNLTLVKRRLAALHHSGLHTERITFHLERRKRLVADFNHDEADELKRFHDELVEAKPKPAGVAPLKLSEPVVQPVRAPVLLPHDTTDFAGREDLLGRLDHTLDTMNDSATGLMLLVGAPGIGKTALVVHWAHQVRNRFPGGVLYADLNGFSGGIPAEPGEVVNLFLAAFEYPVERISHATGRAAKLRSLLAERRALVVLDNAASADAVLPLLDSLINCLVIITSRRGLSRVTRRGAVAIPVPPMPYHEAVAWLTRHLGQRATREPEAVAKLATICDGSPLALRSVADHVSARPGVRLGEFVEELHLTPNLLRLGDDGAGSESIRAVFSWSYRALTLEGQRFFRLLSIHPGPDLSLEAAAVLGEREIEFARQTLDALVQANLLAQPHSRNRYQFHDLLRRYARECALAEQCDEYPLAETRLLDFFLHSAINADAVVFPHRRSQSTETPMEGVTPLRFDSDEQAMSWCVRELANLMAIVHHAYGSQRYEYAIQLPIAVGETLQRLGFYDDVLSALNIAVRAARSLHHLEGEADALGNLGFVHLLLRNFPSAESCIRAAGDLYQRMDDVIGSAMTHYYLGRLRVEQGRVAEGIDLHTRALARLRGQGVGGLEVVVLHRLGEAHRLARDFGAAVTFCREGHWLAETLGDERGQSICLAELGGIALETGDLVSAAGYCARALSVHERLHDHEQAGRTYTLLSAIHRSTGRLSEAERCARRATASYRQARNAAGELAAYDALGHALQAQGWTAEAAEAWSKALTIADDLGDRLAPVMRQRLSRTPSIDLDPTTTPMSPPNRAAPTL